MVEAEVQPATLESQEDSRGSVGMLRWRVVSWREVLMVWDRVVEVCELYQKECHEIDVGAPHYVI